MFIRNVVDENSKMTKKDRNGILYALFWQMSLVFVEIFKKLNVTPNQVTVLGFLFYLAAGLCFWQGSYGVNILGAILFNLGLVMDCADGKLARVTGKTSNIGVWLDYNFDYIKYLFIYPPMVMAIFRDFKDPKVFIFGFVIISTILTYIIITQRFGEFSFAKQETERISRSPVHLLAKQFYAYEMLEAVLLLGFALAGNFYLYLKVWAIYFTVFYLGTAIVLGRRIVRHDSRS